LKRKETVYIGADHAGFAIKEYIKDVLVKMKYPLEDIGTFCTESVDYPDYAERVAVAVSKGRNRKGILTCGTGVGASIAANKVPGIRAALVHDVKTARLSREHNNANLLVLGGVPFNKNKVEKIIRAWLTAKFQGGRHERRIRKISRLEKKYYQTSLSDKQKLADLVEHMGRKSP
jgi:ribose 5-phosphate isomerase B